MLFSSLTFLFFFLPLTLAAYYLAPRRARNGVALAASLLFFAWGAPRFVFPLAASSLADYLLAAGLPSGAAPPRARRRRLALAVALNVALLLYFKYANFGVVQLNALLALFGHPGFAWTRVVLPIGISFFTFQKISYLVDVYRGTAAPARSYGRYLLYVTLFPQLIAGPIVRYHDVAAQIDARACTLESFLCGAWRFAQGLAKKVLLANPLGALADLAFGGGAPAGAGDAWLGIVAYALQIYCDFSGYSDMAVGLGRMLGFEFLENFNFPYVSRSIGEFWRRWHMSLGTWMREYLYIPLGGNRVPPGRRYLNLWLVFVLSGFWHGAAWNFVVWGAYHGFFLSLNKYLGERPGYRPAPAWLALPVTFLLVLVGWVFFRAADLGAAWGYLRVMAGASGGAAAPVTDALLGDRRAQAALLAALLAAFAPLVWPRLGEPDWRCPETAPGLGWRLAARTALTLLLLLAATLPLVAGGFNPFIYFRF